MGFLDRVRETAGRRGADRAQREYTRDVDAWIDDAATLVRRSTQALAGGIPAALSPIELKQGETLLATLSGVDLIAPKNTIVRETVGGSYRVTSKASARYATSITRATTDRPTPIDHGTVAITDRRVAFLGHTRTIEWWFQRMVGISQDVADSWVALHVSNRQKVYGFSYPRNQADEVAYSLALAQALRRDGEEEFAMTLYAEARRLLDSPPRPPDGCPVDPRVVQLTDSGSPAEPSVVQGMLPQPKVKGLVAGFPGAEPLVVGAAARLYGFEVATVLEGNSIEPGDLNRDMVERSAGKPWAAVLSGPAELVASHLDGLVDATAVFVCAEREVLEQLSIDAVAAFDGVPSALGYSSQEPEEIRNGLKDQGYTVSAIISARDTTSSSDREVLHTYGLIATQGAAWAGEPKPVAMVLAGSTIGLEVLATDPLPAANLVVVCAPAATLATLGITDVDAASTGYEEDEDLPSVTAAPSSPDITVAGVTVTNPIAGVLAYLADHGGTVANYDLLAGSTTNVTEDVIRATRRPWMNSRISAAEGAWFIEMASSAPWDLVPPAASLVDAPAAIAGGLYDDALTLWNCFSRNAPKGVSTAKISKVLHLMRPSMFPILDSRLAAAYDTEAKRAAKAVAAERPDFASSRRLYWEAIRLDLAGNADALKSLREGLRSVEAPLAEMTAERISDLRILDMLTWWNGRGGDANEP